MADERLLPAGVADKRSAAILAIGDRIEQLDRSPLLVYRIASVPAAALYALAWQFGVIGLAGWDLAHTDAERRELVRTAIQAFRLRGTPAAIKAAVAAVGYGPVTIEEGLGGDFIEDEDGGDMLGESGGFVLPESHTGLDHWAKFRVRVRLLADDIELSVAERDLIGGLVRIYKNARSHLDSLLYSTPLVTDAADLPADPPMEVTATAHLFYDGSRTYDGSWTYRGSSGIPFLVA